MGTVGFLGLLVGVVVAVAGWTLWAWIVCFIRTKILPEHETHADRGQLARASVVGLVAIFASRAS